jgi:flagellar motility protein MotE (MotC chaperone)
MDPEELFAAEQDRETAALCEMLAEMHAEEAAAMAPFWEQQQREADELAAMLAEMNADHAALLAELQLQAVVHVACTPSG